MITFIIFIVGAPIFASGIVVLDYRSFIMSDNCVHPIIGCIISRGTPVDGESDKTVESDTDINSVRCICIEYQC